jgi:hypothetical protein
MRRAALTDPPVSQVTLLISFGVAALVLVILALIASSAAGAISPRWAHVPSGYADGILSSGIYDYDATAASTTPPANTRTDAKPTRLGSRTASGSSTSKIGRFRAAKGAADDGARLATGRFLSDSWHRATFPNKMQSVRYHWQKHVRDQGINKSFREYTQDAVDVFRQHRWAGQQITLKDGTPGLRIKTGKGQPGGIYTPDGRVVTFWYR